MKNSREFFEGFFLSFAAWKLDNKMIFKLPPSKRIRVNKQNPNG